MAARSDRDFAVSAPAGGWRPLVLGLVRPMAAALARHPLQALGGVVLLATVGAVSVNALAWQTRTHPSPLFAAKPRESRPVATPVALSPARTTVASAPSPLPAPPPAARPRDPQAEPARLQPSAVVSPLPSPLPLPVPRPKDPHADALRTSETGSVTPNGRLDAQKSVAAAQRALIKLGHGALKVDGVLGPGTRHALERFERERKLPVTGELNARTVRELSAQAGLAID